MCQQRKLLSGIFSVIKVWGLIVCLLVATLLSAKPAMAAFSPGQIPTVLNVSNTTVRFGGTAVVQARLTRFDNGQPLQSQPINFFIGDPTYPSIRIGTNVVTDTNGIARVSFQAVRNNVSSPGRFVIVAEYLGNNPYAASLPSATLTVSQ